MELEVWQEDGSDGCCQFFALYAGAKATCAKASVSVSANSNSICSQIATEHLSLWNFASRAFFSNGALPSARVHQDDDEPFLREPIQTLILDNYDSYTYNLFQLLSVINGAVPVVLKNDEIPIEQLWLLLYQERGFHNVVISPGPQSPAHDEDIGISMRLLQECADIPILGVCLGHQALGFCHGRNVVHAPEPVRACPRPFKMVGEEERRVCGQHHGGQFGGQAQFHLPHCPS